MLGPRTYVAMGALCCACGSGSGSPALVIPVTRDDPGAGRDNPGSGRDDPGAGRQSPALDAGGDCLPCGGSYSCSLAGDTSPPTVAATTPAPGGGCRLGASSSAAVLACNGQVTQGGETVGAWQISGQGHLVITVQDDAGSGVIDCAPAAQ